MADVARKAQEQVRGFAASLLRRHVPEGQADQLAQLLSEGRWTHDFPIDAPRAREIGFDVSTDLPDEVRLLMRLYPQPRGRRPSVEYIPLPYGERAEPVPPPERSVGIPRSRRSNRTRKDD